MSDNSPGSPGLFFCPQVLALLDIVLTFIPLPPLFPPIIIKTSTGRTHRTADRERDMYVHDWFGTIRPVDRHPYAHRVGVFIGWLMLSGVFTTMFFGLLS